MQKLHVPLHNLTVPKEQIFIHSWQGYLRTSLWMTKQRSHVPLWSIATSTKRTTAGESSLWAHNQVLHILWHLFYAHRLIILLLLIYTSLFCPLDISSRNGEILYRNYFAMLISIISAKPRRLLEPCSPAQPRARSSPQSKLQPGQLHRLPDPQKLSSRTCLHQLLHRSEHSEDTVPLVQSSRCTSTCRNTSTSTSTSARKLGCHRFHNLSKSL